MKVVSHLCSQLRHLLSEEEKALSKSHSGFRQMNMNLFLKKDFYMVLPQEQEFQRKML